ncbi:MAG: hypothetical protein JRI81_04500 [Deltaproteobacteria bacterium]|nr:hypothetical protein [Deltaproteobacteria bacterium]
MKKRNRGLSRTALIIIVIVGAAILAGYFLGREILREEPRKMVAAKPQEHTENRPTSQIPEKLTPEKGKPFVSEEIKKSIPPQSEERGPKSQEDYCAQIQKDITEFFDYLDTKPYIKHLENDQDSYSHFKRLIKGLSSRPPVPAGEGVDSALIARNVFHLYRVLDKGDIRFIKAILRNEQDTLEMNMDLFYKWLMLGNRCPDSEGIRPPLEVLYDYAGFFLNTIGGRAYLFRRPLKLRLLCTYYSLLIIHEADKKGENSYGIDIFPMIDPLAKEITVYSDLQFREEYVKNLDQLERYYIQKR